MSAPDTGGATVDIRVESPPWPEDPALRDAIETAVRTALAAVSPETRAEISLVLADDAFQRTLNRDWRRKDKPTNVLSFPAGAAGNGHLGDIVLAYETVAREAEDEGTPFDHHLAHLVVHGVLHLLGYDHETDAEARDMEALEIAILARLGVPNPYEESAATGATRSNA